MATSTGHQRIITMSAINELKARAMSAWEADDGQSSAEDIAIAVARRAGSDGVINPLSVGAASAMLATYLRTETAGRSTPESGAAQAFVAARYQREDAANAASLAAAREWLSRVETSRREVQHVICPHSNAWVPQMERAYSPDGSIIATRRMMDDGWEEWQATPAGTCEAAQHAGQTPTSPPHDDARAAEFVATLPSMTAEQARAAYWALPSSSRNAPAIRSLPKAVRRQF